MKASIGILGICVLCLCSQSLTAQEPEPTQEPERDHEQHPLEKTDSGKRTSFNVWPYAFYTPEQSLAFGAGGILIFYTADDPDLKPSKLGFGGYYTINNQYRVSVNPVLYFLENKLFFKAPTSFTYMVDKFWGIGNDSPDSTNETYERQVLNTTLTLQAPPLWFLADRTGLIFDYDFTIIADKQNNQLLLNDLVTGSNGGHLFGIGTDLLWDTRDNIFFPNNGGYQYFKFMYHFGHDKSRLDEYNYASFEIDVRHFRAFKPDILLAGQFYLMSVSGDVPFYRVPAIGGKTYLRGYYTGRYRDNLFMMMQLEFRHRFSKRFGYVVFAGAGDVAPDITNFSFSYLKYSFGAGLRFMFNQEERVNLKADVGFGRPGNIGVYFGIEEAF